MFLCACSRSADVGSRLRVFRSVLFYFHVVGLRDLCEATEFRFSCGEAYGEEQLSAHDGVRVPVVDEKAEDVASDSDNKEATGEDQTRKNEDLADDEGDQYGNDGEVSEVVETPRGRGDAARLVGERTTDPDLVVNTLIPVETRGERFFKGSVKTGL